MQHNTVVPQVLAATPHKAPTIWPPASHHKNYPSYMNQTHRTLLEKQRQAHKWCTHMDPTYGQAKAGWPARLYIQQLYEDTGCSPEDLPEVMNDKEKWRERVRDIHTSRTTWWWWPHPGKAKLLLIIGLCCRWHLVPQHYTVMGVGGYCLLLRPSPDQVSAVALVSPRPISK